MGSIPVDLTRYARILPYASEAFGLYQPLLGWRAQRAVQRAATGLAAAHVDLVAATSRRIWPEVEVNVDHMVKALHGGSPIPALGYSPLLRSVMADQVLGMISGSDISDPAVWSRLLTQESLDKLLSDVVMPALQKSLDENRVDGEQRQLMLEALARRESVVAGTLKLLSDDGRADVLHSVFSSALRKRSSDIAAGLVEMLDPLASFDPLHDWNRVGLSPIGIVHLFRQYFFEFDTFLGPPVQHLWLSPGGTVELVEVSTRKTTVERTVENSTENTAKTEKSLTTQDELSDAVKQENEDNIKLGASVTANERWGWGDASETASVNYASTEKTAREQTHKTMRQQSTKLTTEIKTNFKTTFRTVTDTTDTTSRRYVLSNASDKLVNYELRRKMRQVGVQVQDLGAQLCWQTYVDDPGADLCIARLIHVAAPPDFSSLGPINQLQTPDDYTIEVTGTFSLKCNGDDDEGSDIRNWPLCYLRLRPKDGFEYFDHGEVKWASSTSFSTVITNGADGVASGVIAQLGPAPDVPYLYVEATWGHGFNGAQCTFSVPVTFTPTTAAVADIHTQNAALLKNRSAEEDRLTRQAFMTGVADRIKVVSNLQPRRYDDLRDEERIVVYRKLIKDLCSVGIDLTADRRVLHKAAELISTMFDVDAMLYFVAPEWWRPHIHSQAEQPSGDLLTTPPAVIGHIGRLEPIKQSIALGRTRLDIDLPLSTATEHRGSYDITGDSVPAPLGSSLGWLLQIDGDNQRNAFLNAPWVKAVIPIRSGKELDAIAWIGHTSIEGADGLDDRYQPSTSEEVGAIVGGLEGHVWPPGQEHYRYMGFASKMASSPDTTFLTVRDALVFLALRIQSVHQAGEQVVSENLGDGVELNYLRPDMVFEHGFDPLIKGFRANTAIGQEYQPFTQWTEVLPTDQVVAVEVTYDSVTGRQA